MSYVRNFMLITWVPLVIASIVSYGLGQYSVRMATIVESGFPYYNGVYFGKCAWSGEPGKSREFCATDSNPDGTARTAAD